MEQPRVIAAIWSRVADRPVVRGLAILAAIDWLALALLCVMGQVSAIVTAVLVFCSMVWLFLVLTWYPLLTPFFGATMGERGERAGHFCEQMGIGVLVGMHVIWALALPFIFFRA